MRFMVIVKANKDSEASVLPSAEEMARMGHFNDELRRDGVLLDAEGLQASSKGARIKFGSAKPVVVDGPFAETKELVAGFWIIEAKSKEEAVQRMSRAPFERGEEIEIRQIFEAEDFDEAYTREVREHQEQLRARS